MNELLCGTGIALATPFKDDGTIDEKGLSNLVNHCIDGGVDYLVVLGTTAEVATLTTPEKKQVAEIIVAENKNRVPLVLGAGGNDTRAVIEWLQSQDLSAFSAVLSVVPYYNKPSQEGIYQHYLNISRSIDLPLILYNVPSRTGVNMKPQTVLRLAELPNIVAVKEATDDMGQVLDILARKPSGFKVISGDDTIALPLITAGGDGVISVIGQGFPVEFSQMVRLGLKGKNQEAYALHNQLMQHTAFAFEEGNPVGIKSILKARGICNDTVRLPLVKASTALEQNIQSALARYFAIT